MKFLPIIALAVLCLACGSDSVDMSKIAVTGFPTPLYDGMVSATTGSVTKLLPPHTVVYMQNFELNVNNKKMVKVFVTDSIEGYVPREWLLEGGKLGVINSSEASPLTIYEDEGLHVNSGTSMMEVQLVGFKTVVGTLSQVIYKNDKDATRPYFGYINAPVISDSLSMAFGSLYFDASQRQRFEQNPVPMEALYRDSRFDAAPLREVVFGPVKATAKSEHTTMNFMDEDGNALSADSIPGIAVLHYIWDDNSESDGNHFGDNLEQGNPECDPEHSAMGYKLLFTPNRHMNVSLVCTIPSIADAEGGSRIITIPNAEAGKTYELLVMPKTYGVVCDEDTRFSISTTMGYYGESKVSGSCGD